MRIKELFTVPQGTKVTEKAFGRVLISSVCSILLCMACLLSTSWAWFTANLDAGKIEIDIAPVTLVTQLRLQGNPYTAQQDGSYTLAPGEYKLQVALEREDPQSTAYVLISIRHDDALARQQSTRDLYFSFIGNEKPELTLNLGTGTAYVNFQVTWIAPDGAVPALDGDVITVGQIVTANQDPEQTNQPSQNDNQTGTEASQPLESTPPTDSTQTVPETTEPAALEQPEASTPTESIEQ